MKTIIYSPYECLIKTHNEEHLIEKNKSLLLNETPNNIFVYPTGETKVLPFVITDKSSPYYSIINKNGQLLIFLINGFYCQTIEKHHFSYNGISSEIEVSTKKITFSNKTTKKEIALPSPALNIICKNAFHINYVIFDCNDKTQLILFNSMNGKVRLYEGDTIEQDKNIITVNSDGKKVVLSIDKEGLKEKEKSGHKILSNPLFPALNFMNYLKDGDFASARKLLSPALQESQSQQSLYEYFGDVSYIFPIDYRTIFSLTNKGGKIFFFEIENGKIADINDE